jgi:hypothetical protein
MKKSIKLYFKLGCALCDKEKYFLWNHIKKVKFFSGAGQRGLMPFISVILEAEIRKIQVPDQTGQKFWMSHSQQKKLCMVCVPVIPPTAGSLSRIQVSPGKKWDRISETTRGKWLKACMAQVVEHLLSKYKILISNSSTTQKNYALE